MTRTRPTASPRRRKNHKVILENDTVRVLEATVPLHSREVPHTHFWPSVFFEQTSPVNEPWKTVTIRWSKGGPSKGFHSSDRDRYNLLIELKKTDCKPASPVDLTSTDAVKIHDPNMTVVLENEYVRVLSVRVAPGDKEPWLRTHGRPWWVKALNPNSISLLSMKNCLIRPTISTRKSQKVGSSTGTPWLRLTSGILGPGCWLGLLRSTTWTSVSIFLAIPWITPLPCRTDPST